jgi:glycogen operon protein
MDKAFETRPGEAHPAGATVQAAGVNFSVFSQHATGVTLVLYASATATRPLQLIPLDPRVHLDRCMWHVFVVGAKPGLFYTWRVDGPHGTSAGHRFNPRRELLDPYAREFDASLWQRLPDAPRSVAIRARVPANDVYDWEGDAPIRRPIESEIIYELHVGGFTRHPSAGVAHPGTFAGVIEKIPYLKSLGITAVELLPVMAFDEYDVPPGAEALGLRNFWGYSTYAFHALHAEYGAGHDIRTEFRDMVKALHRAGIAVILDVVFNHTAEGGVGGPTISFRGLDNRIYYHLDPENLSSYRDYTGCGNTVNCNHPVVADFIVRCLEYWVTEMHVDGFRFDLASVLARDETGAPDPYARVVWSIEQSPILRSRMLIAEAWDAVGLHQVGSFPAYGWAEWNDRYRDSLRAFLRGDGGFLGDVATRISGSSDLFAYRGKGPGFSINFITCHDGFTLADLVSYNDKHNEGNGEGNRDGHSHNLSWNSGVEGPTSDPKINALRAQRARNFLALLLLSQGVPMLTAGDERLRSQGGNNNVYCQDNPIGWIDWTESAEALAMLRFTSEMIALRRRHPTLRRTRYVVSDHAESPELLWFGTTLEAPDWHDPEGRVLGFRLAGVASGEPALCVLINMSDSDERLPVPAEIAGAWRRIVDTSLPAPQDIVAAGQPGPLVSVRYRVAARSVVVLESA